ncbi:MAG: spore coat polysaccharide biosynthesis protein E [Stygiobacter sp.]|nr:MAG: spore coat polysaccharide biosynthesis protein E [Stygiobacter sp.]
MQTFKLDNREVGVGCPTYVIAEIGFNHEGNVDLGIEMIRAAAASGADAVKFQTYKADGLTVTSNPHFDLIKHGELDLDAHKRLVAAAQDAKVTFFSTPFGVDMVELLEKVGVPAYKIASMDLDNQPLLEAVGKTGKPIILSTGMGTLGEIERAVQLLEATGNRQIMLLHCVSEYPPAPEKANLRTIEQIRAAFPAYSVGYSDHILGNAAAVAAVALGAVAIEKHFTTDKSLSGPDHAISADPKDLSEMVRDIRIIEAALGRPCADLSRPDRPSALNMRRGLHAAHDIAEGTVITADMIKIIRPITDLKPTDIGLVVGRKAKKTLKAEEAITLDVI